MEDAFKRIFNNKERVLVIMAHPDDSELYAGGTIARLVASDKRVRVVKMTNGENGSRQEAISKEELGKIRKQEDINAMKIYGIKDEDNIYLDLGDGKIENDLETIGKLAYQIREFKPNLIITHNPEDVIIRFDKDVNWINHRDHKNTGLVSIYAAYPYSRDLLFYPEQFKNRNLTSHICSEFLLVDYYSYPDSVTIDVTKNIDIRIKAHASHSSQYTVQHAQESADFFTLQSDGTRFEKFRYVIAD